MALYIPTTSEKAMQVLKTHHPLSFSDMQPLLKLHDQTKEDMDTDRSEFKIAEELLQLIPKDKEPNKSEDIKPLQALQKTEEKTTPFLTSHTATAESFKIN